MLVFRFLCILTKAYCFLLVFTVAILMSVTWVLIVPLFLEELFIIVCRKLNGAPPLQLLGQLRSLGLPLRNG